MVKQITNMKNMNKSKGNKQLSPTTKEIARALQIIGLDLTSVEEIMLDKSIAFNSKLLFSLTAAHSILHSNEYESE